MTETLKPPPTLASCRVVVYAIVDQSVSYSGHGRLFRNGEEVGPVPPLAIGQSLKGSGFRVFYCDRDWNIVFAEKQESLERAKASAEEIYPGVSALWLDAHVSEEEAAKHLEEIWGPHRCNFCGRTPLELQDVRMVEKNGARICASCVNAAYEALREEKHAN